MSALQGRTYESVIRLQTALLVPVTGVLFSQAAVEMRKTGVYSFAVKTLTALNWKEIGLGYYAIIWSEGDMSALGSFVFTAQGIDGGPSFNYVSGQFDIEPQPLSTLIAPERCVVSGNIIDIGGEVGTESWITFRIAKTPSISGASMVEGKIVRTVPDVFGNFSVTLLRGKKVVVEIPQSGLKHTITVPDRETASLVDILPPIVD